MNSIDELLEEPRQRCRQLQQVGQLEAVQTATGLEPVAKVTVGHGMLHLFQHQENEGTATAFHRVTRPAALLHGDLLGKMTEDRLRVTKVGRHRIKRRDVQDRMWTRTYRAMMVTGATTVGQMTEIHLQEEMIGARVTTVEETTDIGTVIMNTWTETGKFKIATAKETEEREVAAVARGGMSISGTIEFETVSTRTTGDDYTNLTAGFSRNRRSNMVLWRITWAAPFSNGVSCSIARRV
jgi:hypothetical protein